MRRSERTVSGVTDQRTMYARSGEYMCVPSNAQGALKAFLRFERQNSTITAGSLRSGDPLGRIVGAMTELNFNDVYLVLYFRDHCGFGDLVFWCA